MEEVIAPALATAGQDRWLAEAFAQQGRLRAFVRWCHPGMPAGAA